MAEGTPNPVPLHELLFARNSKCLWLGQKIRGAVDTPDGWSGQDASAVERDGVEDVGLKSHVMSDWVHGCVGFGSVRSRSDGSELRQFIHVHDVAAALGSSMEHFDDLDMVTDISTGEWVAMRAVGATMEDAVAAVLNLPCTVHYDHANPAKPRGHISPDMTTRLYKYWKPQIQLRQGIEMLVREEAEKFARAKAAKGKTEL
eukprot:CAMPEP_0114562634 /NCGR_PEP_ID=MMETSP0114-20121206/12641_1 /TAXON_ID=31324 /ORGANISM="Goniomonas sp, Strain m" /LENGTH=201 /DNA_ID=CAMNT_0001748347 /DNA_START=103 /DNA_END=709 /DNA_ORIENTATION=+